MFLCKLFNCIMNTEQMPSAWRQRILIPIFKGKGDIQECKNYRGIKLLSHTFKIWERVVDRRMGQCINIHGESNSFGVEVGLHPGSVLSPHLFLHLMDVLTEDVRKDVPRAMMFADDIVLCGDDETDTTEYMDTWRIAL